MSGSIAGQARTAMRILVLVILVLAISGSFHFWFLPLAFLVFTSEHFLVSGFYCWKKMGDKEFIVETANRTCYLTAFEITSDLKAGDFFITIVCVYY